MKAFLKKIRLVDNFTVKIETQKKDFVPKFQAHVDEGKTTGLFSNVFDILSSSENEFKGQVGYDYFEIKRKRKLFDSKASFAKALGTYRQDGEHLVIKTEVNGFSNMMIPFYVFVLIFYIFFITMFFQGGGIGGNGIAIPFVLLHGLLMFGMPYFMMRRSTKRMKAALEREFYYIARK